MTNTPTDRRVYPDAKKLPDRKQRIYDFLHEHPVGVLSSSMPDGNPHGVVVYFSVDETLTVRFLTKKDTRNYDNLKHSAHVALTIFDTHTQTTVEFVGVATECGSAADINEAAKDVFVASAPAGANGLPPIAKLQADAFTAFQLSPVQIRMAMYAQPDIGNYRALFETVEAFDLND